MTTALLLDRLAPILATLRTLDLSQPPAAIRHALEEAHPLASMADLRALVRRGVEEKWICERDAPAPDGGAPVRYSRVLKAGDAQPFSIDAVHMSGPGAGHLHPAGEIDLCFAVSGDARFDQSPEGWTVYAPGTWHVPTVTGGVMDILYFLPRGEIRFGPRPS